MIRACNYVIFCLLALIVGAFQPDLAFGAPLDVKAAGTVSRYQGEARAVTQGESRALAKGASVYSGETLLTGPNSGVEVTLEDGAILILGAEAVLALDDVYFEPDTGAGAVVARLAFGAIRAVSGAIKAGPNQRFEISTPVASIGIRGTEFWGGRLDGVYNFALLGGDAIYVRNKAGEVVIDQIGWGTTVTDPTQPPTPPVLWPTTKVDRAIQTVDWP